MVRRLVFRALTQGKIGSLVRVAELRSGGWSEDMLTGAVMSRMCYLPGGVLWNLLERATDSLETRVDIALVDYVFWPSWKTFRNDRREPDVYLVFQQPDGARIDVIVEAKADDLSTSQRDDQRADQIDAFLRERTDDLPSRLEYIRLGGQGRGSSTAVEPLDTDGLVIRSHTASWLALANACARQEVTDPAHGRILADVRDILEMAGHRERVFFGSLAVPPAWPDTLEWPIAKIADA